MRFAPLAFLVLLALAPLPASAGIPSVKVANDTTDCVRVTLYAALAPSAQAYPVGAPRFVRAGERASFSALKGRNPAALITVRAEPMAKADCSGPGLGLTQTEYRSRGPGKEQPVARIISVGMRFFVRF